MDKSKPYEYLDLCMGGEWWHISDGKIVHAMYDRLIKLGVPNDDALEILDQVISAVSNEYGN